MMHRFKLIRWGTLGCAAGVDLFFIAHVVNAADSVANITEMTSQNNLFLWIISGLCAMLFTVGCWMLSKAADRLDKLETRDRDNDTRLVKLETKYNLCPNCPEDHNGK